MMRYIRYAFLLVLAVVLVTIAFANRDPVTLRLLPDDLERFWPVGRVLTLPLFIVIFAALAAGVVLGFVWEWLRAHATRAEASRQRREKDRLQREVARIKGSPADKSDEVLQILDGSRGAR
jgi:putative membrane protein